MNWKYEQATGKLTNPENLHAATGYSGGDAGQRPDGVNNPAMQSIRNVGPIPKGTYTFGEPVHHSHLGPFAIPLVPDPANEMYGRDSFYCHGDNFAMDDSASDGCIIMPRSVRNEMWASECHVLEVI